MRTYIAAFFLSFFLFTQPAYSKLLRLISTSPSITHLLLDLGAEDNIVGKTRFGPSSIDAEIIGTSLTPDILKIISLKPDYILLDKSVSAKTISQLEKLKIDYLIISLSSIGELYKAQNELSKKLNLEIKYKREKLQLKKKRKEALLIVGEKIKNNNITGFYIAPPKSFHGEILSLAGWDNSSKHKTKSFIPIEEFLKFTPKKIFYLISQEETGRAKKISHIVKTNKLLKKKPFEIIIEKNILIPSFELLKLRYNLGQYD